MVVVESLVRSENEEDIKRKYYYRMVKNEIKLTLNDTPQIVQCYGIEVERHDIVNDKITNIERDIIEKISPYRYKVHSLLKILFENAVSPLHLVDVLSECVDDYTMDFDKILSEISTG